MDNPNERRSKQFAREAGALYARKKWRAAIRQWEKAIQADPRHWEDYIGIAAALERIGKWDEAEARYILATGIEKARYHAWRRLGKLRGRSGRYMEALEAYAAALQERPDAQEFLPEVEWTLYSLAAYPEVIEVCQSHLASTPDSADAHYFMGLALEHENRLSEALTALTTAATLKPEKQYLDAAVWITARVEEAASKQG